MDKMTDQQNEPREFWIAQGSHADVVCYTENEAKDLQWSLPIIHVIEAAPVLAKIAGLDAEVAELMAENKLLRINSDCLEIKIIKAENERDSLKQQVAIKDEAIEVAVDAIKDYSVYGAEDKAITKINTLLGRDIV